MTDEHCSITRFLIENENAKPPIEDAAAAVSRSTVGGRGPFHSWALFSSQKILQNFSHFPSHRIFKRMHRVLNIDENKN